MSHVPGAIVAYCLVAAFAAGYTLGTSLDIGGEDPDDTVAMVFVERFCICLIVGLFWPVAVIVAKVAYRD